VQLHQILQKPVEQLNQDLVVVLVEVRYEQQQFDDG